MFSVFPFPARVVCRLGTSRPDSSLPVRGMIKVVTLYDEKAQVGKSHVNGRSPGI